MYLLRPNVVKGRKNYQQNYKIHEMLLANLMSEWAIRSKNEPMSDSLICSFLVSEKSDSLTLLISSERPERMSESLIFERIAHSLIL